MKKKNLLILLVIFGFLLFGAVNVVSAVTSSLQDSMSVQNQALVGKNGANLGEAKDIRIVVANIIKIFLSFLGTLATVYLFYGGYMYMTSAGNDQRMGNASKIMLYSALGLFVILASYSINSFIYKTYQRSLEQTNNAATGQSGQNDLFLPR